MRVVILEDIRLKEQEHLRMMQCNMNNLNPDLAARILMIFCHGGLQVCTPLPSYNIRSMTRDYVSVIVVVHATNAV